MTAIRTKELALNRACQPLEPLQAGASMWQEGWQRGQWLLGLMLLQSLSGAILASYEHLIKNHIVVTLFLTMLVGAGGNAGNQSTIKVIEGMASGEITVSWTSFVQVMQHQVGVGLFLSVLMTLAGFLRVLLTNGLTRLRDGSEGWELTVTGLYNCIAISISLLFIVFFSCLFGTLLPFAMAAVKIDAANAGPSIQVLMDIVGVIITCYVCKLVLQDRSFLRIESFNAKQGLSNAAGMPPRL